MDEYTRHQYRTNCKYRAGYDAAANGEQCPAKASPEFKRGYYDFHSDMTRSESRGIA
jgi:hypothetical protein